MEVAPTLDLGLVPRLRESPKVFLGVLPGGGALLGEFLADEQISGHCPIDAHPATVGYRPSVRKAVALPLRLRKNAFRAEGEKLVQRVRKFVEVESGRIGYSMTADALSEVSNGAKWNADPSFNVADAILADPEFASVLKIVLRDGHVMVPALKAKGK